MSVAGAIGAVGAGGWAATSAAIVAARRSLAERISGEAKERLDALGDRAVTVDLYSAGGADVYHAITKGDTSEVRELLALLREADGPVLELAAGTGRLTLPLLAAGREVTAVDLSDPMLAILRRELAELPEERSSRCKVVRFDMVHFRIRRRGGFGAAILGGSSVSLLDADGRRKTFRRVHDHLAPGGLFMVSTAEEGRGDEAGAAQGEETVAHAEDGSTVYEYWPEGGAERVVTVFPPTPPEGPVPVYTTTIGVLPTATLSQELTEAGFAVRGVHPVRGADPRHPMSIVAAVKPE